MQHMTMLRGQGPFQHSMPDSNFCLWEHGGNTVHHIPPRNCYLTEKKKTKKQMVVSDQQCERNLQEERKAWQFFASSKLHQQSFY